MVLTEAGPDLDISVLLFKTQSQPMILDLTRTTAAHRPCLEGYPYGLLTRSQLLPRVGHILYCNNVFGLVLLI